MKTDVVAIASDHAGVELKEKLKDEIKKLGLKFEDLGTEGTQSVDYPDYADALVKWIKAHEGNKGVLICGSGIGMSIAANRHKGIRAALVHNGMEAELARKHNNANVLCLGARTTDNMSAKAALKTFLNTAFEGGRHEKRVEKLG
jgi:ribose 5-phosphate isomerase B